MPDVVDHPNRRGSDQSFVAKVNYWFALRGFIIWTVSFIATATIFTLKFIDLPARVDSLEQKAAVTAESIQAITKLQCFNRSYTLDQLYLAGLDCRALRQAEERLSTNGTRP